MIVFVCTAVTVMLNGVLVGMLLALKNKID